LLTQKYIVYLVLHYSIENFRSTLNPFILEKNYILN